MLPSPMQWQMRGVRVLPPVPSGSCSLSRCQLASGRQHMQTARPGTSRQLPALQASPQPDGPATALSINCKTALCIWDVENVPPFHPVSSAPVQLLRIQELLTQAGVQEVRWVAAANPRTRSRLASSGLLKLLKMSGVEVIKVSGFSDAADVVLISEAYKFVQQALDSSMCAEVGSSNSGSGGESSAEEGEEPPPQGEKQVGGGSEPQQLLGLDGTEAPATPGVTSTYDSSSQGSTTAGAGVSPSNAPSFGTTKAPCACLVCISQDVRFAQVLAYATSRGLYTIALAPFRSMRPAAAAMARAQPLHSLPLARACRAAVHWVPAPQPLSLPEQLWLEECHGKLHRVWQPRVQPAEAGAAVAASGAGRDSEEACAASTPTGAVAAAPPVAWQTLEECPGSVLQVWVNPGEEQGQQQQQHGQAAARASAGPAAGRRGKVVQKGPQPRQQQGQHGQRPPAQPSRGQKQQQGRKRA